ncbi:MAG: DUF1080 domain-containing protein [Candidatus Poribacteria bacterium]|nr:DUF1080 domain-containing protein [Candidatus Poribacteria bacterium]
MKFVSIVAILFLFTSSVWAGTFVETFGDGDLEGWKELVQLNKAPGSWEIVGDELHAISRETFIRLLTTGDNTWEDYTVEFDIKPLKKHGISSISIAARVKGTWVVYCSVEDLVVIIDDKPPVHQPRIVCVVGNLHGVSFASLHDARHPLLKLNKWSHLKLSVQGDSFTFWINGEQVMEPTKLQIFREVAVFKDFPDFLTGGVGFGLSNYTARFDNITITGDTIPNSGGFTVTSQDKLATTWGNLKRF